MRIVVVVALASGLLSVPALADGEACTLKKALKVSIGGKWETLAAGDPITITTRAPQWSTVDTKKGPAKASSSLLETACGLAALDKPAADAKADKTKKPAEPAAPVAPVVAVPVVAEPAVAAAVAVATPPPAVVAPVVVETPVVAAPAETVAAVSVPEPVAVVPSGPAKLVAVLDLKPSGVGAESAAGAFTTMLAAEVAGLDGYKSISRNEIKSILSHQADAQLAGCAEIRCAADVAQLVNADVLITGQLDKVGGASVVSLSLIDAGASDGSEGPAVLSRQEFAFRGPDDMLLTLARPLVQRLFDGANAGTHLGTMELFTEDGATVILDGKEIGAAPLPPVRDLPTGVHTVMITKGGRVTQTFDVVLARNETTITRVELVEESLFEQPWFWAAAGGAVLVTGGAAAGITLYVLGESEQPTRVVLGKQVE
ncbi:MAG: PEGA domain-containing protein [Deltaproteobacteria bacterium]|nr:PEGA domain-containing protein [Deltaproteobacteria bacterium]